MSYSRRQLYAMGEPLGDSVTRKKAGGGLILGDGGGNNPTPSNTTVSSTELPSWATGYAKDTLANAANLTDINKNPYKTYGQPRIAGFSPMQEQAQTAASNMSAGPEAFGRGVNAYMSPYMQNVVDVQKQEAARQSGIMGTQQQAQATQAGAFGGSRDAIMRAERERNLGQQMNQIQAQGSQAAYDQAANQFRQGITQDTAINQLQNQYGGQQQQLAQRGLDVNYQDFLNQQNYPYKQIGFMSDLIRGLPLGQQSTQSMYQAPPSMMQNIGALGMGAYGAKQLGMFAEGGQVSSYADGGEINPMDDPNAMTAAVAKLSDEQLQQIMQHPSSAAELQAAKLELATRASERGGLAGAYNMAQGGVVAFDDGGPVGSYAPGDPVTYQQALRDSLGYNAALSKFQPSKGRTREEQEADAKAYFKLAQELGGPDPYADYERTLKGFEDEDANMLSEGKGLAALQAAAAMLQGNDPARAIGSALGTFGTSYGQTLKESRARKRASAEGQFQLASERRKERMGLGKEALAREAELAKAIREGDKERVEVLLKQAQAAAALAQAAKPYRSTGGGGAGVPKGVDAAAAAIYAELRANGMPEVKARAQAYREAIALSKTSDVGPTKTSLTEEGYDLTRAKDIEAAKAAARKALMLDSAYATGTPEYRKQREAEAEQKAEQAFRNMQRTGASGAKPAPAGGGTRLKFDANGNLIQ